MTIRVPNAGDAQLSESGTPGDLLVRVNVAPSKVFRRQGANLYHDARIPWYTAVLGGRVRVPTLDGDVDVRVPGGTQQGEEMVLKGRGVSPVFGGEKGDLFVAFAVQLPRCVNKCHVYVYLYITRFHAGQQRRGSGSFCSNMLTMSRVGHRRHLQLPKNHRVTSRAISPQLECRALVAVKMM